MFVKSSYDKQIHHARENKEKKEEDSHSQINKSKNFTF